MTRFLVKTAVLVSAVFLWGGRVAAQTSSFDLLSPDKRIEVRVKTASGVRFDVLLKGRALLEDCSASMISSTRNWD